MLKGLALTPPIIGRIAIGKIVRKDGKRLPEKDDEFTITSQVQSKDGWIPHPIDETLRGTQGAKLRSIPVRLLFNDPDLNLRASYTLFERTTGRPLCVGDGETCRRVTSAGMQTMPCPTPDVCEIGNGNCKPYGRLNVRLGEEDELGSFIFRTTGFNSIRTLAARLRYFYAVTGGLLSTLPLELRLRGKSTVQSHRASIYYVDLTVRPGMSMGEAIGTARADHEARRSLGFDQVALDAAASNGFSAGAFEESQEEGASVSEEFLFVEKSDASDEPTGALSIKTNLSDKLDRKVASTLRRARATL
jgi:hypothetical protein